MMKFHDETPDERKVRLALEERRRDVEELMPKLEKIKKYLAETPGIHPHARAELERAIAAGETFLKADARERNLDDLN